MSKPCRPALHRPDTGAPISTVTVLTFRSPAPWWELPCGFVPVINPWLFRPPQHPTDFGGNALRADRVRL